MEVGDEGGVGGAGGEGEGEFGGLRGAGVGAHVHVGADDGRVEEQQGVGVVQAGGVELVDGAFQQVAGVAEFTGEQVGDGPAADGGGAAGQRLVGELCLGGLEVPGGVRESAGFEGAFAESEVGGGPDVGEVGLFGPVQDVGEAAGGVADVAGGEDTLGVGEGEFEFGGELGGSSGGEFVVGDAEAFGDVSQGGVGGLGAAGFEGGDVGGGVGGFGESALGQSALVSEVLDALPDGGGRVFLGHGRPFVVRSSVPSRPIVGDAAMP
ncbi:hypothetical protein GCM10010441_05180 [Kitasatospora paracochleata]